MTERRQAVRMRLTRMQVVSYVLIVLAGAVGFLRLEANDRRSCEDRIATREAVREVYRDTADLGRSLVTAQTPPDRAKELLEKFDTFERERLREFPSIEPGCPKP